MRLLLLSLVLLLPFRAFAQTQPAGPPANANVQHTTDSPAILEGPQTPGTAPAPAAEPSLMNNETVLKMHRAGLGDDLILQTIATQPGRYDTTPDSLIALKQAGLSDSVLAAMTNKARRQLTGPPPPEPVSLAPVNEIGVYYRDASGRWQPMESEPVHSKSSGWLKNTLSDGIVKTDMNGMVNGPESRLLLPRPIEFLIYTADGVDAGEYTLIRFRLNTPRAVRRTMRSRSSPPGSRRAPGPSPLAATRPAPNMAFSRREPATSPTGGRFIPLPSANDERDSERRRWP
jgi:hypothetical protein